MNRVNDRVLEARWRLRRWLSEPKGQLQLIALTFLVAVVLAVIAATQRSYFQSLVREKYPGVSGATERLAADVESGAISVQELETRGASTCDGLYAMWMQAADVSQYRRLPVALAGAFPAALNLRLERTFVAGNAQQRRRAAELLALARDPALAGALELGLRRARAIDDDRLITKLTTITLSRP